MKNYSSGLSPTRGSHERGFALLFLLLGLPVAFIFMSWLVLQFSVLHSLRQERGICRDLLRRAQVSSGQEIQAVIAINPSMSALQLQTQKAQAALAAAMASAQPPLIAAARSWLQSLEMARQSLVAKQQTHIMAARALLSRALIEVPERINSHRSLAQSPLVITREAWSPSPVRVALQRKAGTTRFPQYELKRPFERRQSLEVLWNTNFQPQRQWPVHLPFLRIRRASGCGVTLIESTRGFEARPSPVRSLLRPSS